MNNPSRNYNSLTVEEQSVWTALQAEEIIMKDGKPTALRKSLYRKYPKAVRHYLSLFPNNFIDAVDLTIERTHLIAIVNEFQVLVDIPTTTEQEILNFIKSKNAYFLIGSILKSCYRFGHHALYILPELPLTINYKVDFVLIGKNSDGHHFVFVELENPYGSITKKDGDYGTTIRKGIKQIDDWEIWLEKNYSHLKPVFERVKNPSLSLPNEFFEFDKTRMHYVIVAGRRNDFIAHTHRINRMRLEQRKLLILHYDNIIDEAKQVIGEATF